MFLKRLLYLRAALDNEQSLSQYTVPFEDENGNGSKKQAGKLVSHENYLELASSFEGQQA